MLADALSRKLIDFTAMQVEWMLVEQFRGLDLKVHPSSETAPLANMSAFKPVIIGRIKENQKNDPKTAKIFEQIAMRPKFKVMDSVVDFRGRLCVPDVDGL